MSNYDSYIGKTIENRYTIVNIVGVGGMAIVFGAYDCVSGRSVAIKLLRDDLEDSETSMRQFVNESEALSMLNHPNIVKIFTTNISERMKYFVMEYVEGITLKKHLAAEGVLGYRSVLYYSTQILKALSEIHSKGIIHSDIKPHNILLIDGGHIKVADFGISRLPDSEPIQKKDTAVGTVYYVSPEQASGDELTPESDIYSLGVMMYEMITGQLPFYDDDPTVVAGMHIHNTPRLPRKINPKIPLGVEQIILKAMAKEPENRYRSAGEMLEAIALVMNNSKTVFDYKSEYKAVRREATRGESNRLFSSLFGIASAFLAVTVISICVLGAIILHGGKYFVEVPDLCGMKYAGENSLGLDRDHFDVVIKYQYSSSLPQNTVISQSPAAGDRAGVDPDDPHCTITLTVSRGERMNDYTAMDAGDVRRELSSLGFIVRTVENYSNIYREGCVYATYPTAGESVPFGSTVTVYESLGAPHGEKTEVPLITGKSLKEAISAISDAGLAVGKITFISADTESGTVTAQSLPQGSSADYSNEIDLTVSSGNLGR